VTANGPRGLLGPFTVTETNLEGQPLSGLTRVLATDFEALVLPDGEAQFLPQSCGFVRYLGSGRAGTCACTAPGL